MTSLRTLEGASLQHIKNISCEKIAAEILYDAEKYLQKDWMKNENEFLTLTQKGKLFADGIAAELFRT